MKALNRTMAALSVMMLLTFAQVTAQTTPSTDVTRTQYNDNTGSTKY